MKFVGRGRAALLQLQRFHSTWLHLDTMSDSEAPVASTSAFVPPPQTSTWESLKIEPFLINALKAMACRAPTGVQAACIPPILAGTPFPSSPRRNEGSYASLSPRADLSPSHPGADCIGSAQTGSGKTIAFALPIMQALAKDPYGFFAIVLTPTRFVFLSSSLLRLFPSSHALSSTENSPSRSRSSSASLGRPSTFTRRSLLEAWT